MTYALLLAFFATISASAAQRPYRFSRISWASMCRPRHRAALFVLSCVVLIVALLICRAVVTFKLGKVLIAVRDAESRHAISRYRVDPYKLFVFTLSACMAGVAGALYVPQVGIIIRRIRAGKFHRSGDLGRGRRRGTLIGAALGAVVVNYAKTYSRRVRWPP